MVMSASHALSRDETIRLLASYVGITTADGAGTFLTLVCSDLATQPNFDGNTVLILSGTYEGQSRLINGSTLTGIVTVDSAFDGLILKGVIFAILSVRGANISALSALLLKLARSAQSGSKTLTGAYATIYSDSDANPWIFSSAWIDLTNMDAGDTVWIRISTKGKLGGAWVVEDELSFSDAQPAAEKAIRIKPFPNVYGVLIEAYQSAGAPAFLALDCEFFVAKK